ncbi:MAG: heavy metal translocating P-type ATPase metal-binding domain-containing protein [Bryobacterales bacterium]|nr:heavy metal translocating P-type ATPase metal-binding domain-containing protein [Bryobacterales bacterium]
MNGATELKLLCDLCTLECRNVLRRSINGAEKYFCCLGCQNVYTILVESGVVSSGRDLRETDLFKQSLKLGLVSTGGGERRSIPPDAVTTEMVLSVSGMWCTACGWLIEHAVSKERGVVNVEVAFASDLVRVKYCPQYLPPQRITERIESLGYRAQPYDPNRKEDAALQRDLLLRIGVAGFLWMNVMLFSLPIYASYWEPIWDSARRIVPFVLMALATPAVFYSAWPIHRMALLGLRHATLRMETLLSLGIFSAYGYSTAQAIRGGQHYYFDTACAIVTLVLLGKLLERGAKERTAKAIALLHGLMPNKARVLSGDRERFVSVEALQPGISFLVKAGERIPADGVVTEGAARVDESVLTGESAPLLKQSGDPVICGSLATDGTLEIRATRASAESTLTHIIRAVEDAIGNRSSIERTVDRVTRLFVPAVVGVAAAVVGGGIFLGVPTGEAILRGIAVLVIACPCALGVATPLAVIAAVGSASRRGILVTSAEVLETVAGVDTVVLDKTGTVTRGNFQLLHCDPDALPVLAAVERFSEHPLAAAVVAEARRVHLTIPRATNIQVRKGQGITGELDAGDVAIGNRSLFEQQGEAIPPELTVEAAAFEQSGATVAFWRAGARRGMLAFGDSIKPDAKALVDALRGRGIRTVLLSGDAADTTASIAKTIGVDEFHAEVLPAQKAQTVQAYQRNGKTVAMVGDGVNDAPALAAADLGIALGTGADLAMQAAPVVVMHPSLLRIMEVFDIAAQARRVVSQNLFWAFAYNVAGITLAATGILNPIFAAAAMVLSSVSVIGNSRRLQ